MTKEKTLIDVFMEAASTFRQLANRYHGSDAALKDSIVNAANEMFLARDAYGAKMPQNGAEWTAVCMEVGDAQEFLRDNDIHMNFKPVQTSTGRTTYRILNPSRSM